MRVLLIANRAFSASKVEASLVSDNHICHHTESGEDGMQMARLYDYDIIVLALDLEDVRGDSVLRDIRNRGIETPVLALSGPCEPEKRIDVLLGGADDYMTKPFDVGELIARMKVIVRRSNGHADSKLRIGRLVLNHDQENVTVDGVPVTLEPKEYRFLEFLALRKGRLVTIDNFLDYLYDGGNEPCSKIVEVYICKLRKKLIAASGGENPIETVWGRGYILHDLEGSDARNDTMTSAA